MSTYRIDHRDGTTYATYQEAVESIRLDYNADVIFADEWHCGRQEVYQSRDDYDADSDLYCCQIVEVMSEREATQWMRRQTEESTDRNALWVVFEAFYGREPDQIERMTLWEQCAAAMAGDEVWRR